MPEHRADWTAERAREAIWYRQGGQCALCWGNMGPVDGRWEAHHRLKVRNMPRNARWCTCDLVGLDPRCHTQGPAAVHDHPDDARVLGLILDAEQDPRDVVVQVQWPWTGEGYLDCEGMVVSTLSVHPLAAPVQDALPWP